MAREIFYKVSTYNTIGSREGGPKRKKYGFAADIRLRHYKREIRLIRGDMKTTDFKGWLAAFKRLEKKEWTFTTSYRGQAYFVKTTPGAGGFIIVQDANTGEVVACMLKYCEAQITSRYWRKVLTANR